MIITKKRTAPLQLTALEALLPRIPDNHPLHEQIRNDKGKWQAGYAGERNLDYFLTYLPDNRQYWILHNLRLIGRNRLCFQIDTVILTSYYVLILEIKNYAGKVHFDDMGQVTRTYEGYTEGFPNPLEQARRQNLQLKRFLFDYNLPAVPILTLSFLANRQQSFLLLTK